ncbi:hypothetical protein ACQ3I4_14895 [Zafaria sp. Z1313]|uniref:hypothetical protein n=1 Tax=unclassified Zafaria TaxID=2828765 RepID=UPI002E7A3333|nr:hypothetical protein [Zafaria sp. J156]MEE1622310.1 hypothetical protein [Zafaria sp. J156]
MEAILFPTSYNQDLEQGLASHWLIDGVFYPTEHNRHDPYALPSFELEGQWVYPSKYNPFMPPELPALALRGHVLLSANEWYGSYGLPMFTIHCLCHEHLEHHFEVADAGELRPRESR